MSPLIVLQQLTAASSRSAKEKIILEAYSQNCFEFFEAAQLAADPFISFGLKKVAAILEDDGAAGTFTFADFRSLCQRLQSKTLIEATARAAIHRAAETCHVATWNQLYRRVLLKDLPVDQALINKVLDRVGVGHFRASKFQIQQASNTNQLPPAGQRLFDVKLNGNRLFAMLNSHVWLYSAKGVISPCAAIEDALQPLATHVPAPIVLDGVQVETGEYIVFDLIPLIDFRNGSSIKTQRERRMILESLHRSGVFSTTRLVRVLPQIELDCGTPDGSAAFAEFNQQAINHGHTAIVIKKPEAVYVAKKTTAWLIRKTGISAKS